MGLPVAAGSAPRRLPSWQDRALDEGIVREPSLDGSGVALWIPKGRDSDFYFWERISSVPHAEFEPSRQETAILSSTTWP
jgi:hypothetical protein